MSNSYERISIAFNLFHRRITIYIYGCLNERVNVCSEYFNNQTSKVYLIVNLLNILENIL